MFTGSHVDRRLFCNFSGLFWLNSVFAVISNTLEFTGTQTKFVSVFLVSIDAKMLSGVKQEQLQLISLHSI